MDKPRIGGELRANVWQMIEDGLEGPVRAGIHRAYKHRDDEPSTEMTERLVQAQMAEIMTWFTDYFIFDEGRE